MAVDAESLYRRYGPMVLRRCRRLLGDDESARDAMHDVFVRVIRYEGRLKSGAAASLLWRIATQVALNRLRTRKRRPEGPEEALVGALADLPDEREGDESERASALAILRRLFGAEPVSSRVIAVLHYVDGMTLEETAAEVGLSVSGVRKRLRVLRERLGALVPEGL